ncbi:MAG: HD domain-containing phosphohydrolase [Deferrisomatales bacterium]|nr:HD domain-containing phosphohydrolase [Deferrisomatales bacterium]
MTPGRRRALAVSCLFLGVTGLHLATPTAGHWAHAGHVFLRELYFLPIVAAAVWFGAAGALATAAAAAASYAVHQWLQGAPGLSWRVEQAGALVSFFVLASVAGALSTLERRARQRALRSERRAERERVGTAVAALAESLSVRDPETGEHSRRVAVLSEGFASFLGLPRREAHSLYLAGIMHDVGKIGIRDDVLLKPEKLTPEERRRIMDHPRLAERILAPVGFEKVVRYVAAHHENVDGTGYPEGVRGAEIPLPARVLAIADTYDALRHVRPYKEALREERIRRTMDELAGKRLDGELLAGFWEYLASLPSGAGNGVASPPDSRRSASGRAPSPYSCTR